MTFKAAEFKPKIAGAIDLDDGGEPAFGDFLPGKNKNKKSPRTLKAEA